MEVQEIADELIEKSVQFVKENYPNFSDVSHRISEGSWEEWIRNHIEAKIFSNGGLTLSGHQK
jgi:hypothetical protein